MSTPTTTVQSQAYVFLPILSYAEVVRWKSPAWVKITQNLFVYARKLKCLTPIVIFVPSESYQFNQQHPQFEQSITLITMNHILRCFLFFYDFTGKRSKQKQGFLYIASITSIRLKINESVTVHQFKILNLCKT